MSNETDLTYGHHPHTCAALGGQAPEQGVIELDSMHQVRTSKRVAVK
ncbi:MAG: hypothetical protein HN758_17475 [Verrucomicrobia bacterium]|nr:hypothetical protein [Verrucomicrobiota bacterium]MBT5063672.1 hypothetical protein [Verrucomicrobiota bacterium]MBT5479629.1 hypothetical protein [Verrucomicrobiota bacterium]MBT6805025.1 hypothetical protein [Verrucomicrobiota bacterium]MBT7536078.1 hypothetical protein [Verrucomicrobiota bacterium]